MQDSSTLNNFIMKKTPKVYYQAHPNEIEALCIISLVSMLLSEDKNI